MRARTLALWALAFGIVACIAFWPALVRELGFVPWKVGDPEVEAQFGTERSWIWLVAAFCGTPPTFIAALLGVKALRRWRLERADRQWWHDHVPERPFPDPTTKRGAWGNH